MIKTLSNWFSWVNTNKNDDIKTWKEWQNFQPSTHYDKSDIFKNYLIQRPNFNINSVKNKYYLYCFGDFSTFLVYKTNIYEYILSILDIYDVCKGFTRRIIGDPEGISILRHVISTNNINLLENHNFKQYDYPYNILHAHTLAHHSLSTLLMNLISNYMKINNFKGYFSKISLSICKNVYENNIFGSRENNILDYKKINDSIPINTKKTILKNNDIKCFSWPREQMIKIRCKSCNRVTENNWGKFNSCIDCHLKRICSECGIKAVVIGEDDFPKCYNHKIR